MFDDYDVVIFFDTETTGLNFENDRVTELAFAKYEPARHAITKRYDRFLQIDIPVPEKVVELTGITDQILAEHGDPAAEVFQEFLNAFKPSDSIDRYYKGRTLLVAHNADFDIRFVSKELERLGLPALTDASRELDFLDTLTVYKDRRAYPHKLNAAINAYGLQDKVKNSHRAIDDCLACAYVCRAMAEERNDLECYVNVFGYNPKYGCPNPKLEGIAYHSQSNRRYMCEEGCTLPALIAQEHDEIVLC